MVKKTNLGEARLKELNKGFSQDWTNILHFASPCELIFMLLSIQTCKPCLLASIIQYFNTLFKVYGTQDRKLFYVITDKYVIYLLNI